MRKLFFYIALICFVSSSTAQKQTISISSELDRLRSINRLPKYDTHTVVRQFSSYDTTGKNDDGFSGKYSFIRKNPDGSLVVFEAEGNGVINRIWTPTPTGDTLDFYFGGGDIPSFSVKFSDLFSGKIYPFILPLCGNQLGGYYCYFPIPYQNGCKVVSRGKQMQFYQIQYRHYPDSYEVKNFSPFLNSNDKSSYEKLIEQWAKSYDPSLEKNSDIKNIHTDKTLSAGETITLAAINNGGRIVGIKLKPSSIFTGLHKQIDIRVSWDNDKYPAIDAPVADFFGYAYGKASMQSLLLGSADDVSYCYFPMPFDNKAKIELTYRRLPDQKHTGPLHLVADVFYTSEKRIKKTEGKFYAFWKREINPPMGQPYSFLSGEGKGHYVGTILQAQGLRPGMTLFFEGDDVTFIDGQMTMHGTGSEDYFNGGWYALLDRWDRKMSLPLHGSLDYSLPFARTGGYRLFLSDKMPFEKSIRHTIEHGPEDNNIPVDYTSLAMYYAEAPLGHFQKPTNELTKVCIPDTMMVYRQLMKFRLKGTFTMDGNAFIAKEGGHLQIDLAKIPKGNYKLYADGKTSEDGAVVSIWQRQTLMNKPVSFYSTTETKKRIYLCDITIDDFKNTITLHFNPDKNKRVNIERLILIKK